MKISHNEITGAYYEEKTDWTSIAVVTIGTIITLLIIADVVFGAEEMAEMQGEVIYQVIK